MRRATIHFRGRVQGVGFRQTARSIAGQFEVTGFVRNEPDGQVLALVEGNREEIVKFIDSICQRMIDNIQSHTVQWSEATGKWSDFSIDWNS